MRKFQLMNCYGRSIVPIAAAVLSLGIARARGAEGDGASAIRTPAAGAAPRINGPRVYGERPGRPFFYHLPVTGQRPITIVADHLPDGLSLDAATGNISGTIAKAGESSVTFTATNAAGQATGSLKIVAGPTICLTPPMGWNSWNCFHATIDRAKIAGAADAMVATGLVDHGWTYINMDDGWEGSRDAAGNIHPSEAIGEAKSLSDYIHGKGLKFGLYSTPGPLTCDSFMGSYGHEEQDAATYASWNVDYLKYDGCTFDYVAAQFRGPLYAPLLPREKAALLLDLCAQSAVLASLRDSRDPSALPQDDAMRRAIAEYAPLTRDQRAERSRDVNAKLGALFWEGRKNNPGKAAEADRAPLLAAWGKMGAALAKVNRDIVYSFSMGSGPRPWEWGASAGGNLWRISNDISSSWASVESHAFNHEPGVEKFQEPGHWNDPDMLEIGNGKLTADEDYTHMTMWCMRSAPLLIGCDISKITPLTISIFSNDEVIAVDQDELGKQGWRVKQDGSAEVWMKPLADGSVAAAFFNRGEAPADVSAQWSELKLTGAQKVRDLWRQKDVGVEATGYSVKVAGHGAELFKLTAEKAG